MIAPAPSPSSSPLPPDAVAARERPVPPPPARLQATRAQRLALLIGLAVAAWLGLQLFASILLPFVAAGGIAYLLDPPTTRLTRLGVPRFLAALLMVLALIALGLVFALLLYPVIVSQFGLLLGRVPQYAVLIQHWAQQAITDLQQRFGNEVVDDRLRDLVSGQAAAMLSFLATTLPRLIGGGFALFNVLTLLVVTPIVAFYLLRDWPMVIARIDSWLPRRYAALIREQAREVDRILAAWVRGQALCCLILALIYSLALTMVGLDLGLIVGMTAGLLSFIPYVGTVVGGVTALGLAFAQFQEWEGVARVGVVMLVGNLIEGYIIYPRLLGDRVELPDVWVIFALFAGGAAFGFLGVMLAVPIAATIGVLARFWLRRYLSSPLYLDPPHEP